MHYFPPFLLLLFQNKFLTLNNINHAIILCEIYFLLGYFILLLVIDYDVNIIKHSPIWWVTYFFFSLFPSTDHLSPNIMYCVIFIQSELFLLKFSIFLFSVQFHQRYFLISALRDTTLFAFLYLKSDSNSSSLSFE